MTIGLYDWDTPDRSTWGVMDDFGNLTPCNMQTWWVLFPEIQIEGA